MQFGSVFLKPVSFAQVVIAIYHRSTNLLHQVYFDGNVAGVTGANYCPGYNYMVQTRVNNIINFW